MLICFYIVDILPKMTNSISINQYWSKLLYIMYWNHCATSTTTTVSRNNIFTNYSFCNDDMRNELPTCLVSLEICYVNSFHVSAIVHPSFHSPISGACAKRCQVNDLETLSSMAAPLFHPLYVIGNTPISISTYRKHFERNAFGMEFCKLIEMRY